MQHREIDQTFVRQDLPGLRRRWFQGDTCDLSVWQDDGKRLIRFMLFVKPDLVVQYESGHGMITGRGMIAGRMGPDEEKDPQPGQFPGAPMIIPDDALDLAALETAFNEFTSEAPSKRKRVLFFVAQALDAALTGDFHPHFPTATLPLGPDSALMDPAVAEAAKRKLEEKERRKGLLYRIFSVFRDDDPED